MRFEYLIIGCILAITFISLATYYDVFGMEDKCQLKFQDKIAFYGELQQMNNEEKIQYCRMKNINNHAKFMKCRTNFNEFIEKPTLDSLACNPIVDSIVISVLFSTICFILAIVATVAHPIIDKGNQKLI